MHVGIRADGAHKIGLGHLYRSAVAATEALERGHRVTVLTLTPKQATDVYPSNADIVSVPATREIEAVTEAIADAEIDAIVTDSNNIDLPYQRQLSDTRGSLTVILDDTRHPIHADVFVNGNIYAPDLEYDWRGTEPDWCLGTEYLLLREPFSRYADETHPFPSTVTDIVVTMGGTDDRNLTPVVLSAFDGVDVDPTVIIGPGFENGDEIRQRAVQVDCSVTLYEDPETLPALFRDADAAVCALGTTTYELLATQTPTIGVPVNQTPIDTAIGTRGGALVLSRQPTADEVRDAVSRLCSDRELRRSLWRTSAKLVSGAGPENVINAVERVTGEEQ